MSFDPITYSEAQQLRAHFVLLNGSPEAISVLLNPAVTPSSFAAWLGASGKLALFEQLMAAPAAVGAVAANTVAMAAVIASSTAMAAVAASSTAMAAVAASSTAMAAVAASSTAMAAVIASSTAMAAVIASSTAMAQIRQSSTALTAINASSAALDALYAAATKFSYAGGSFSANPVTLVTGNFLLVRITTRGNPAGWGEGAAAGSTFVKIGGALFTTTTGSNNGTSNLSARAANPFVQDSAARAVNNTTITYYLYNPTEIAYLAA